ncbi:MAG: ABC-type multidrug transport system, ATPase component [Cyanobacteria bacterium RYN_339]|nr:ABC-type multidrug transport system, ATPase component [Cyanobacteria bacterium RYN_339]
MFEFTTLAPEPNTPAIDVNHLRKRYGDFTAVDDLSFTVNEGDFFAFLGPNGAGKTTTINAIVGLVQYQQGIITVFNKDVQRRYREARAYVGLAPQEYNFDRYLTIEEILIYQAGYFGIPKNVARPRARQLLQQFELWTKRDSDVTKLSGGMKRRLTLARALIHAPRVLILDEPTAGVDVELRLELWDFLRALNRQGMTIFLTTHYLEEAEQLCNRVGIINAGKLVALDDKQRLLSTASQDVLLLTVDQPVREVPQALTDYQVELELDGRRLAIRGAKPADYPRILRALESRGHILVDMEQQRSNLQDIFLRLTGKGQP